MYMKQRIFNLIAALLFTFVGVNAQTLSVSDSHMDAGWSETITVNISDATEMTALQFNLTLPEGVNLGDIKRHQYITLGEAANSHMYSVKSLSSGDLLIVVYNLNLKTFKDGVLMRIPVNTADDLGESAGRIYNVRTSTVDAVSHECSEATFKVIPKVFLTVDKASATLTTGETLRLNAEVWPTNLTVEWASSDESVATVENGVVTAVAAGTATITAKAGDKEATCVVTVTKKEEPEPTVASGEYYLYHAESKRFLARGEHWGTCATVDRYGIPFVWTAEEYSLKFLDSNVHLFETDDSNVYTDNASTGFTFEEVEGGYLLKSQKSNRYLTIVDAAFTHDIVNVTDDASAAVVWQLKSKAEHDAIVAGYVEENYMNVIKAAGLTATAGDFADYLATLTAEDKTSAIGTARFNGSAGDWTFTEVRHQDWQPAYGADFCELWQATGSYTQTLTGLAEGIYKVTVQGYERSGGWAACNALGEKGYEITTATLSANGEEINLKSWYSDKTGENNPNNTGEAVAKFGEGKYMNEVYTYVGADGTLTLMVNKPSHVGDNWMLFNNFTLTHYAAAPTDGEEEEGDENEDEVIAVSGIALDQTAATLTEGETMTLEATVTPANATDKTVTWESSKPGVATVDANGKVTAIAAGKAVITAKAGDKTATCVVTVNAAEAPTGVEKSEIKNQKSAIIYDLQGRRILNTENLKSGLYIIDGMKTVIK